MRLEVRYADGLVLVNVEVGSGNSPNLPFSTHTSDTPACVVLKNIQTGTNIHMYHNANFLNFPELAILRSFTFDTPCVVLSWRKTHLLDSNGNLIPDYCRHLCFEPFCF